MDNKRCIVTVAFRHPYLEFNKLQRLALNKFNPDIHVLEWINKFPIDNHGNTTDDVSHFQSSCYGFKPHAIRQAIRKGYNHVLWLDSALVPITNIDRAFELIKETGFIANQSVGHVNEHCRPDVMSYFGLNYSELEKKDIRYYGGSVYGFDFTKENVMSAFIDWEKAEESGCFGTQDDMIKGHKTDEVCMALAAYKNGIKSYNHQELYHGNPLSLWINMKESAGEYGISW